MPKVKPLIWTPEPQCNEVKKNIQVGNVRQGIDTLTLAKKTGIKQGTLYNRMKDPGDFKLSELCMIAKILKVDLCDLVKEGGV